MKAAIWHGRKNIRVEDVPEPPPPDSDAVKIKVHWTGICGSDLHEYEAGPIFIPTNTPHPLTGKTAPIIMGHEFSGEIVEVGQDVRGVKIGDRVASDAAQHCQTCAMCKKDLYNLCEKLAFTGLMTDGAFAEYVNVPAYTLYHLPPSVSTEAGAFVEPAAVGVHAVRRSGISLGDSVAIAGAGTIGLVTLQAVRAAGAGKVFVIEMAEARKDFARKLGATDVLDPNTDDVAAKIQEQTNGLGVDAAFECVGVSATVPMLLQCTRRGGKIVVMGIFEKPAEIHFNELVFFERELIGSIVYHGEFADAISLMADGRIQVEPCITARITLDEIVSNGFEELLKNKEKHIKILVSPR